MSEIFSGIFYPKKRFYFEQQNEPPLSAEERLLKGNMYNQELQFVIDFAGNSFKYDICMIIFTNQVYKRLTIKELSFLSNDKKIILVKEKNFSLPKKTYTLEEKKDINNSEKYWLKNRQYHWTRDIYLSPINSNTIIPKYNFEKLFKTKKIGENFKLIVNCIYSFDEAEEQNAEYIFKVKCEQGEYISPFLGF